MNRLLVGKKAIEYRKANSMEIINVSDKESVLNLANNYLGVKGLKIDISDLKDTARLPLLKFVEESKELICVSLKDIQDPILLSRFCVEKESTIVLGEIQNMNLVDFCGIYRDATENGDDTKMLILENCPRFITIPKGKILEVLVGG